MYRNHSSTHTSILNWRSTRWRPFTPHYLTFTPQTYHHPVHRFTPRLKNTIFNNGRNTTYIPTDPHTVTTTDIKTNMRHIHRSIVSRHLATRGNNKILRTPHHHTHIKMTRFQPLFIISYRSFSFILCIYIYIYY